MTLKVVPKEYYMDVSEKDISRKSATYLHTVDKDTGRHFNEFINTYFGF